MIVTVLLQVYINFLRRVTRISRSVIFFAGYCD